MKPQGEPVNQRAQAGGNETGAPWGLWDKGSDCSLELELDCLEEQELSREWEGLLHTWASSGTDPKRGKAVVDLREDDCGWAVAPTMDDKSGEEDRKTLRP